jgi:hypothetical protein
MKVKYKVLDYRPEAEWIAVEFFDEANPDREPWVQQFVFPDFSRDKLTEQLRAIASRFAGSWTRIPDHPAELSIPETGTLDVEPELYLPFEPNPQYAPEPEFDEWTQEIRYVDVSDDPYAEVIPWEVVDLTKEQIQERLDMHSAMMREQRDYALMCSDFIFSPDISISTEKKAEWCEYRQKLRDLTLQSDFPKEIDWPQKPTGC